MKIPDAILARLEANEQVAKKFHHIEMSVLTILNFQDFFEQLLTRLGQTFQVPHVWISIFRDSAIADQILAMEDSAVLKSSTSFVTQGDFLRLIGPGRQPLLANQNLDRFLPLVPPEANYDIGSIAIAPIFLDGEGIGSLNQADSAWDRFMPGIDTDLLARLALKISLCLSNVAAHEKLRHLAFHDPLTGLLNRRVMVTILEREFERAKRYQTPLSVVFLDLDNFKQINDTFGHDQGDRALICFAQNLDAAKRANDIVARFAGDEFVVILPSTPPQETGSYLARLKSLLAQRPLKVRQSCLHIDFSWGVAAISDRGITQSADLLRLADQQLYAAKKAKRPSLANIT